MAAFGTRPVRVLDSIRSLRLQMILPARSTECRRGGRALGVGKDGDAAAGTCVHVVVFFVLCTSFCED